MRISDLLLAEYDLEMAFTRKHLERVPEDQPELPHPDDLIEQTGHARHEEDEQKGRQLHGPSIDGGTGRPFATARRRLP